MEGGITGQAEDEGLLFDRRVACAMAEANTATDETIVAIQAIAEVVGGVSVFAWLNERKRERQGTPKAFQYREDSTGTTCAARLTLYWWPDGSQFISRKIELQTCPTQALSKTC